jgi:hypothetical protein
MDDTASREELEQRHTEQIARANAAIAAAQDRSYWLDRWNLDLNAVMRRRGASELRAGLRALRAIYRLLYDLRSKLGEAVSGTPGRVARARRVLEQERELADPTLARQDEVRRAMSEAGLAPTDSETWVRLPAGGALEAGSLPGAKRVLLEVEDLPASAVLAGCTPDWRVALYVQGDPDVYVLERR